MNSLIDVWRMMLLETFVYSLVVLKINLLLSCFWNWSDIIDKLTQKLKTRVALFHSKIYFWWTNHTAISPTATFVYVYSKDYKISASLLAMSSCFPASIVERFEPDGMKMRERFARTSLRGQGPRDKKNQNNLFMHLIIAGFLVKFMIFP